MWSAINSIDFVTPSTTARPDVRVLPKNRWKASFHTVIASATVTGMLSASIRILASWLGRGDAQPVGQGDLQARRGTHQRAVLVHAHLALHDGFGQGRNDGFLVLRLGAGKRHAKRQTFGHVHRVLRRLAEVGHSAPHPRQVLVHLRVFLGRAGSLAHPRFHLAPGVDIAKDPLDQGDAQHRANDPA
ncbi:hypothetical protein G6F68_013872 [Rhizopus microsporus]|nr:hypothetical protein G6F68_013872 [Rhizopus microsporus]